MFIDFISTEAVPARRPISFTGTSLLLVSLMETRDFSRLSTLRSPWSLRVDLSALTFAQFVVSLFLLSFPPSSGAEGHLPTTCSAQLEEKHGASYFEDRGVGIRIKENEIAIRLIGSFDTSKVLAEPLQIGEMVRLVGRQSHLAQKTTTRDFPLVEVVALRLPSSILWTALVNYTDQNGSFSEQRVISSLPGSGLECAAFRTRNLVTLENISFPGFQDLGTREVSLPNSEAVYHQLGL